MNSNTALRSIMFVGTGSDVGKSVITAGFCRIFRQDGYHPAPFKGQNMSLNSYATPEGLEIGRAQAVQAEACGIPCHTDMNPVLLKPVSDRNAQVIVGGRPIGSQTAKEYFLSGDREDLFTAVTAAYHRLAARYSPIVMEGAGSISELNLKHLDITNMRMAMTAGAAAYLIADIDRGGVFGSLYGTMSLLPPEERACIKGIIINKFRGDPDLFADGRTMLEELCGVPVIGVLPYFRDIFIEEEDSVVLAQKSRGPQAGKVNIAVILLEHLSNFTDFDFLDKDPRVNLFYTRSAADIANTEIIILPGSKNTIEDLRVLQENGLAAAIQQAHAAKTTVIGICGGFQMMGEWLDDPLQVETKTGPVAGLGLLPVRTVMQSEKITRQRSFRFRSLPEPCNGYEIHMGLTHAAGAEEPLNHFTDAAGGSDGYYLNDRCWGTYLHGILDNPAVTETLIARYTDKPRMTIDHRQYKEEQYDRLAALLRLHLDIPAIYKNPSNLTMLHGHGDNAYVYGREILADFSSNVWYGGEPAGLKEYLFTQWDRINKYPEVLAEGLSPVIARHHGLEPGNILVTAGTTESIYLLAQLYRNNDNTGIVIPAFSEYEDACRIHGHQLHFIPQPAATTIPAASLLWIGNPNNPTGAVFPSIGTWVQQHPRTLFIVDEAFIEFTNAIPSSIGSITDLPNLVVLRSLTKAFAIPGLRLGYIAASPAIIENLKNLKMPWSVNALALAAGHYIFDHYDTLGLPLTNLLAERAAFITQLQDIPVKVTASHTHFFCCETPSGTARELKEYLVDHHGILIRDAANFRGLSPRYFRLATGTPDRNKLLINALKEWLRRTH